MKAISNPFLRHSFASIVYLITVTSAHAVDYNYGSIAEDFTLTPTDHARALPGGSASGVTFNDNSWGGVYDRGSDRDATYMHFDLSSLAGSTINGTVNFNLTIDANYGGAINGGIVGSATNAWSYPGTTGGITTISGADPSGNYSTGQTATAVIDNTTFQGFVTTPATFNGLAVTAGSGSTAHFTGATLTGNATVSLVSIFGGTDWSAGSWNAGTSILSISGTSDVSGGVVTVRSGGSIAVSDSATLGSGSFSGNFANSGNLSFGSSSNQTLSGVISGSGSLDKSGAGTLTLTGSNSYAGGTTIDAGTVIASGLGSGAVTIASGATLSTTSASSTGLAALYYNTSVSQANIASLPALLGHFGANSPTPSLVNTTSSVNFATNGTGFPSPYNGGASNFEALYSGKVNIGTAGTYTFNTSSDDGSMLFIDGQVVVTNNFNQAVTTRTGTIALSAGMHDIVIAYNQGGGGYGMNAQISGADDTNMVDINTSNANITPDLVVGSISGAGSVVLSTGNLITGIDNSNTNFSGVISGIGGVTKFGTGTLTLSGSNTNTGKTTIGGGNVRFANTSGTATVANVELVGPGSFLIMEAANQFGSNAGLLFNSSGGHNEFALYGNNQTIASLASTNQFAVVQNSHGGYGSASASSTLTVNQTTDTTYSGMIRDNTGNDAFTLALVKSGAGKLKLTGPNSYTGGTTINSGTVEASRSTLGTGAVVINNGGTLYANDQWVLCGANQYGEAQRNICTLTINAGVTLYLDPTNGFVNGATNLYINGGAVTGGANSDSRGALFLWNGNEQITAGGATTSSISVSVGLTGNNNTITVESGSTLNMTEVMKNSDWYEPNTFTGGFIKAGTGTLNLSGGNSYSGLTNITAGTLLATSNTALGSGGWSGSSKTDVANGATLALQGGISLDEHMHIVGAGVGGLGAIRSISGNNSLTMTEANSGSGPGLAIDGNTTIGVDADKLTVTGFYHDEAFAGSGITKVGNGTLEFSSSSTYTGATTVSAGTMLVTGQLGNTAVTVESNGVIGGSGIILGSLNLDAGADLLVNLADPLEISGNVTFDGFGFANLLGWDYTTAENGTYTLLAGSNISLTNVANVGLENAFDLGAGRKIYFQTGSLQAVVVPESSTLLLGALGVLGLLRRRR